MKLVVTFLLVILEMHLSVAEDSVISIKDQEHLDTLLSDAGESRLVVIEFWSARTAMSVILDPEIKYMASTEFPDVTFLKVDIDALPDVANQYNTGSVPAFLLIKNRIHVIRLVTAEMDILRNHILDNK